MIIRKPHKTVIKVIDEEWKQLWEESKPIDLSEGDFKTE